MNRWVGVLASLVTAQSLDELPQRDLARRLTRLSRDGLSTAAFANCCGLGSRCAMGAIAAMRAEARLRDSFHDARSSRSKIVHELEPRYGIEP